jgi:hypothetical protein
MNRVVVLTLVVLGCLAVALAISSMVWEVEHNPWSSDWYLGVQVRGRV